MADPNTLYAADFEDLKDGGRWKVAVQSTALDEEKRTQISWRSPWPFARRFPVHAWDLTQKKTSTDDWIAAFRRAIEKRTRALIWPAFVGLSSGHDSGAIHLALGLADVPHKTFTIKGKENMTILHRRLQQRFGHGVGRRAQLAAEIVTVTPPMLDEHYAWVREHVEPFGYGLPERLRAGLHQDGASTGLSIILKKCREQGVKVYFSGTGGDEIISDYARAGKSIYGTSDFNGSFPTDLSSIFPWRNFYFGQLRNYLMKEEHVAGAHGMETRYPFLDRDAVQEFLWLDASLKNSWYKRPIRDFFVYHGYPFEDKKVGFDVL
eukprot:TRINITY_DN29170_c0_g1_i3.p1 TRINITY_DN29170_c0_g1~~TRINITY_DN29170_c0_g1_i3.p1  ORF type:complete len:321 (-),score=47.62 TRINITY_DN29170_c0_g1_i3:1096-2058(-)